jgi:hypothetical protein
MQTTNLREQNAAHRAEMARLIEALALETGATAERCRSSVLCPQETALYLRAARGLCVRVEFDGQSVQPDVYVLSWHTTRDSDAELNQATFGGSVNRYHRQKATYVAHGFDELRAHLRSGLELAASGRAFLN